MSPRLARTVPAVLEGISLAVVLMDAGLPRRHFRASEKRRTGVGKTTVSKGSKVTVVADGHGLPIGLRVDSARLHASRLAEPTLATIRVPRWHRLALPPLTPPPPGPSVPPGDDATLPDLAGHHWHYHGRIRAERRSPRLSLSLVITSRRINLTAPVYRRNQEESSTGISR
jgi:hypothetical protein